MTRFISFFFGALLPAALLLAGCHKLGLGGEAQPESTQRPTPEQLKRLHYMSQAAAPGGGKIFDQLGQAKSCRDLQLAMLWNRPPDVVGGAFGQKMTYLSSAIPRALPKQSEVFITGRIERGESLPSGSWGWTLETSDGTEVEAIEPAEYWEKEEQAQQEGGPAAIVKPNLRGRRVCGYGIYQGMIGRSLKGDQNVPLVSVLFAIDRRR